MGPIRPPANERKSLLNKYLRRKKALRNTEKRPAAEPIIFGGRDKPYMSNDEVLMSQRKTRL